MNQKVKLEDTVILIDTVFYNFLVTDIKNHFEKQLNRTLEVIDLPTLTTYLSLDMGLCAGDNTVQLLWLYTKQISDLQFTKPSSLKSDLDGKAFQNEVGEFLMASVSTEDLLNCKSLICLVYNQSNCTVLSPAHSPISKDK